MQTDQQYFRSIYLNYIRVIIRGLRRRKAVTFLKVFGISLTFLMCMIIFSYVGHEWSYDKYHDKSERIYRATYRFQNESGYDIHWARMNQDWVNEFPASFPEIEKMVRIQSFRTRDIQVGNQHYRANHAYAVDREILELFDFTLIKGDFESSLGPNTVVLTSSSANKYFGNEEPIGQVMKISNDVGIIENYTVTAVIEDPPSNTHLPVHLLTSINSADERTGWAYVYFLLKENTSINSIENKIDAFVSNHESLDAGEKLTVHFQALPSIHLNSQLSRELTVNGDKKNVALFISLGVFLLLISTSNFINLNTIQSLDRVKEFGLRLAMGSNRQELRLYLVLESFILCLVSALLAVFGFYFGLTYFERFIGNALVFSYFELFFFLSLLIIIISFLAGLTSSSSLFRLDFKQISNWFSLPKSFKSIRKQFLLFLQFSSVLLMVTSMVVIQRQFFYMTHKDLGYSGSELIVLRNNNREVMRGYETLKSDLKQIVGVEDVTAVMQVPTEPIKDQGLVTVMNEPDLTISADIQVIDLNAVQTLEIDLVSGTELPMHLKERLDQPDSILWENFSGKARAYLVNETACQSLGYDPNDVIGKEINWSIGNIGLMHGPIVGVVKDYHQESLNATIRPTVMIYEPLWVRNILVRVNTNQIESIHDSIQELWLENYPDQPLELSFLDTELEDQYQAEKRQLEYVSIFTFVAIMIAFLGLYGMMAFTIKLRVKELAIRKVLGSNWYRTMKLLISEYLLLAIFSMMVAFPLAFKVMNDWLSNYAYRVEISGDGFVISGVLLSILILLTLAYHIFRNEHTNPSDVLKSE